MTKFFSRTIHRDGKAEQADHVIGIAFAKAAFYVKATHAEREGELVVAAYANSEKQARELVEEEGFAVLSIAQYPHL